MENKQSVIRRAILTPLSRGIVIDRLLARASFISRRVKESGEPNGPAHMLERLSEKP
jgi:hypothetical protein